MDDPSANIIDLRAHLDRQRSDATVKSAAAAVSSLDELRSVLRNLNLVLQLHQMAGSLPSETDKVHEVLGAITKDLASCLRLLGPPPA